MGNDSDDGDRNKTRRMTRRQRKVTLTGSYMAKRSYLKEVLPGPR